MYRLVLHTPYPHPQPLPLSKTTILNCQICLLWPEGFLLSLESFASCWVDWKCQGLLAPGSSPQPMTDGEEVFKSSSRLVPQRNPSEVCALHWHPVSQQDEASVTGRGCLAGSQSLLAVSLHCHSPHSLPGVPFLLNQLLVRGALSQDWLLGSQSKQFLFQSCLESLQKQPEC